MSLCRKGCILITLLIQLFFQLGSGLAEEITEGGFSITRGSILHGPFRIGDREFYVQVIIDTIAEKKANFWSETAREFRVVDESGPTHYREEFPLRFQSTGFSDSFTVQAHRLIGEKGEGIILHRDIAPSAPGGGRSIKILSLKQEALKPISPWITVNGAIERLEPADERSFNLGPGGVVNFSVWTGYFAVDVPMVVDLETGNLGVPEGFRDYPVQVEGHRFLEDLESATLSLKPSSDSERVVVPITKNSSISYNVVRTTARLYDSGHGWIKVEVVDPWLKVTVDGLEGWVTGDEGFLSVGLLIIG